MRSALILALASVLTTPPAQSGVCNNILPDSRSSEGCLLELGAFPLQQPNRKALSFYHGVLLADILRHLGAPASKHTIRGRDPRDPEIEFDNVDLSYPGYRLGLECFLYDSKCWLIEFELTDSALEIGCGLRVGLPVVKFLKAIEMDGKADGQQPLPDKEIEFGWEKFWCEGDVLFARHAGITLHTSEDGIVKRISWRYFAD